MCGPKTNTTTTQTQPNANAMAAYQNLLGTAQGTVNNNPFQTYGGEFTAPVNAQQYGGIGGVNQYSTFATPYIDAAANYQTQAGMGITPQGIQSYLNPYTQNVVNATEAQFNNQNAQQQQQVLGNAAIQGALGGDRVGVAQANLAGQQQLAQAPVIANLYNTGYNQAVSTAEQQVQNEQQAAYGMGNLGVSGQAAGLQGAGAQIQAGTLEQQTQQQYDAALYNQFMMQQAFPYQQTQWLAGVDTGVGSQMGGTSQTTGPPPSWLAQALGLTTAGVGAATQAGAFKPSASGGRIAGFDSGGNVPNNLGNPLYGGVGFIPSMNITHGSGAPKPPSLPGQPAAQSPFSPASIKALMPGSSAGVGAAPASMGTGAGEAGAGIDAGIGGAGIGTAGADVAVSTIPEATAAAGAGAASAADLLPLLFLKSGGLVAPRHNQIRLHRDFGGPVTAAGFGTGSMVPRWPVQGYDDGGEVIDMGYDGPQEVSPEAMARWRRGVDVDIGRGATAQPVATAGLAGDLPPEITQGAGGADGGLGGDGTALAYAGDPATGGVGSPTQSGSEGKRGSPGWFTSESGLGPALMAAGFGMMASRSPFPGVAIGEGGMQGLQAYSAQKQMDAARAEKQQEIGFKQKHVDIEAAKLAQAAENSRKHVEFQAAQLEETKRHHDVEASKPFTIATTPSGVEIKAVRDPKNPGQFLDVFSGKPIDPAAYGIRLPGAVAAPQPNYVVPGAGVNAPAEPQERPAVQQSPTAQVPPSPIKTAFGTDDDAALPLRAILNSSEPLTGTHPEVLDDPNLTPGQRNKIKAIAEGKAAFLPVSGRGNVENKYLMGKAYEYNPNLDQTTYQRRQRVENFFSVGTQGGGGQQVIALNRFAAHTGSLLAIAEKLDEGQYPNLNSIRNAINKAGFGSWIGDKKEVQNLLGAWDVNAKGVGDEAAKVFAGSNPALADRETWHGVLNPNTPLSVIKAKLRQAVEMSYGALGPITAGYNEGMRTNHQPRDFLTPQTQAIFDAVTTNKPISSVVGHGAPAAAAPPAGAGADPLAQAREAIAAGKDRNAVIQRLREHGINPSGL